MEDAIHFDRSAKCKTDLRICRLTIVVDECDFVVAHQPGLTCQDVSCFEVSPEPYKGIITYILEAMSANDIRSLLPREALTS